MRIGFPSLGTKLGTPSRGFFSDSMSMSAKIPRMCAFADCFDGFLYLEKCDETPPTFVVHTHLRWIRKVSCREFELMVLGAEAEKSSRFCTRCLFEVEV